MTADRLRFQIYAEIWASVQRAAVQGNPAANRLSGIFVAFADNDLDRIRGLMRACEEDGEMLEALLEAADSVPSEGMPSCASRPSHFRGNLESFLAASTAGVKRCASPVHEMEDVPSGQAHVDEPIESQEEVLSPTQPFVPQPLVPAAQ
jgi:hypothetical protein